MLPKLPLCHKDSYSGTIFGVVLQTQTNNIANEEPRRPVCGDARREQRTDAARRYATTERRARKMARDAATLYSAGKQPHTLSSFPPSTRIHLYTCCLSDFMSISLLLASIGLGCWYQGTALLQPHTITPPTAVPGAWDECILCRQNCHSS